MLLIAGSYLEDEKRNGSFLYITKEMLFRSSGHHYANDFCRHGGIAPSH
jgi:hypothetical protein